MDVSQAPLSELRRRCAAAGSDRSARRLVVALRGDGRHGARALAEALERRLQRRRSEGLRVARLFARRRRLRAQGARFVAGVDEVGVGPLAGPVVAAAVVLPDRVDLPGLNDSKRLTHAARERLAARIREQAVAVAVAEVSRAEIDRLDIRRASLEAMRRAVEALAVPPDHVLVDAHTIPGIAAPQTGLIHGDASDGSIAAASIVAKVHRDRLMQRLHARYPEYGFGRHMGYPTRQHLDALRRFGPSPAHRRSFAPVAQLDGGRR
ncbi:MAG: ribonuclease HII [Myxococcales bacterium]|nr:ribonuclease HII [Myxococcales bacterium]